MSGLLARLGRQLAGPSLPRVRSRASLPYASLPAFLESPATPVAPEESAAVTSVDTSPPARPAPVPSPEARRATVQTNHPTEIGPAPIFSPKPGSSPLLGRPAAARVGRDDSGEAEPHLVEVGSLPTGTSSQADPRTTAAEIAISRDEEEGPINRPAGESWQAPQALWPLAAATGDAAEGSLRRDPAISSRRGAANGRPTTSGPAGDMAPAQAAPDEVHVHIGRIEVTAVVEPQAAPPRSRRGPAPMTLDDYLRRRGKEGA